METEFDKVILTIEQATELVWKYYNLRVSKISEKGSYFSRVYMVKVDNDGYVFKVSNKTDSKTPGLLETQNYMMNYLSNAGLPCQRVLPSKNGNLIEMESDYAIRLLTFIPGQVIDDAPVSAALSEAAGAFCARLEAILKRLDVPFIAPRLWDLGNVPLVRNYVHIVEGEERQKMMYEILESFDNEVVPVIPQLKDGFIHGDLNEGNLLVDETGVGISGVIDWEDACHSKLIFELGILVTYQIIIAGKEGIHPCESGGHALKGYREAAGDQSLLRFSAERKVLPLLVAGRLAQSLVYGEFNYREMNPDNPYLMNTAQFGWKMAKELWNTPREFLLSKWHL